MINWREISDADTWELFARDFLAELGFVIEVGPGRGPDAGRDLLVSEQLKGTLHTNKFTWLVSCKHFAVSGKSVGTDDEVNITDRLEHHSADGFLGFYSTLPSAALVARLQEYKDQARIKAYEIFDAKKIEGYFFDSGFSKLALRYFPESYGRLRPIQQLLGEIVQLRCDECDADILARSVRESPGANLVWSIPVGKSGIEYEELFVACKGECDHNLQARLHARGYTTGWEEIADLFNPILFLKNMLTYMNQLHEDPRRFSDKAHKRMKQIYIALAQRTLREITKEDMERFKELRILDDLRI
jgi:hypothetical protein